ncbi:MAG: hypothetical protein ACTSYB_01955 [Candidatus Helarchaeota archaeon]
MRKVLLNPINKDDPTVFRIVPSLKNQPSIDAKATAYICINNSCKAPVTDIAAMLEHFK